MTKESSCFKTPTKPVVAATELAPGFRFHPTDVELVSYYLKRKVTGKAIRVDAISEIDLYRAEPWDLPPLSRLRSRDLEWYFFTILDHKYSNRCRTNRSTIEGYWKTTGKDRPIQHHSRKVGMKKTLVYHSGRAPRGQRTNWVMHEYRLEDENLTRSGIPQDGYVLCRIFQKSGLGPQNGAQYGAPFIEEEWEKEEEEDAKPVSVNVVADDGLIEPSGQDFVQLGDFLQNSNSGIQHIDAFPSRSTELELGSLTEDSSNFVEEVFKDPNFSADITEDADFSVPQVNKCSHNQLNCVSMQRNGYVQLEDILTEGNQNSSSDDSIHCPSVVDGVFKSEIFLKIPDEGNLLNTNCAINQPEHLQLYSDVEHDMFPQLFDPLDDAPWEYPSNCMIEDSLYCDAFSHDVPYSEDGLTVKTSIPPVTKFDFSEDLMLYYEAAEDKSNPSPEVVGSGSSSGKEVISAKENLIQQSSLRKRRTGDGISSILNDDLADAELKIGSKSNTLGKRLASMLNSISAPPAFADEVTLIGKTARQIPAASLHLTANVIQLGNLRAVDYYYTDSWTLQKKSGRIAGKSRKTALGLIYSTFCKGRFPLFFVSAAVFGLSCKLGFLELPHCLIRA